MNQPGSSSLESNLRKLAVKWALIGLFLTVLIGFPCLLYSAKSGAERKLLNLAQGATRAFRPMILDENYRDVELQMRSAYNLKPTESAIIRDSDLVALYPLSDADKLARCSGPNKYCWSPGFKTVTLLYPIYFNSDSNTNLLGYLELSIAPSIDWNFLSIFGLLLLIGFVVQSFGLSSALAQAAQMLIGHLSIWAEHIKKKPGSALRETKPIPFSELQPMQEAVRDLHIEINRLKDETAFHAQLEILREIGHDLRTPHSQLAKYFALHIDTLQTKGVADPEEIERVRRTLRRMGELIRQFRALDLSACLNIATKGVGN